MATKKKSKKRRVKKADPVVTYVSRDDKEQVRLTKAFFKLKRGDRLAFLNDNALGYSHIYYWRHKHGIKHVPAALKP